MIRITIVCLTALLCLSCKAQEKFPTQLFPKINPVYPFSSEKMKDIDKGEVFAKEEVKKYLGSIDINPDEQFLPLGMLKNEKNQFEIIFFLKESGAGGISSSIYLATIGRDGTLIDRILFSLIHGDCSFQEIIESEMESDNLIKKSTHYEEYDCDKDSLVKKTPVFIETYRITSNGIILTN